MEVIPATITATILIRTMMGLERVEGPGELASTITKTQVRIWLTERETEMPGLQPKEPKDFGRKSLADRPTALSVVIYFNLRKMIAVKLNY